MALLHQRGHTEEKEDKTPVQEMYRQSSSDEPASELSSHTPTSASSAKDGEPRSTPFSEQIGLDAPEEALESTGPETNNVSATVSELPPVYEEIVGDSIQNADDEHEVIPIMPSGGTSDQAPEPAKKPNVDLMMLGKQQDVTGKAHGRVAWLT